MHRLILILLVLALMPLGLSSAEAHAVASGSPNAPVAKSLGAAGLAAFGTHHPGRPCTGDCAFQCEAQCLGGSSLSGVAATAETTIVGGDDLGPYWDASAARRPKTGVAPPLHPPRLHAS
jgi:hypothetical protein